MTTQFHLDADTKKNFHIFWDNFSVPALLLYKDRTILAVNKTASDLGIQAMQQRCFENSGGSTICSHCKANNAMLEKMGKQVIAYVPALGQLRDAYWIPLAGQEDVYVHFGIALNEYVDKNFMEEKCADARVREERAHA